MPKNNSLTVACAKGYLWQEALNFFKHMGYEFDDDLSSSRQLSTTDRSGQLSLLKIRPWDVPVYVEEGAADLGIVGKDVLVECQPNISELLDLHYGGCRLVIAGPPDIKNNYLRHHIRVATKYPNATVHYFQQHAIRCVPIHLYGAMELAPSTGVSDIICDLTATGQTMIDNGLEEFDEVVSSTARLISNQTSLLTKFDEISLFRSQLANVVLKSQYSA